MASILQRVEIEQANAKEVLKSRFDATNKGLDLLVVKIDSFEKSLNIQNSAAEHTPAGKQLLREILTLERKQIEHQTALDECEQFKHEISGALRVVQWVGFGSILTALAAITAALRALYQGTP